MPWYTYKCSECESIFETFHLMSEVLEKCEKCDAEDKLTKIPSQINLYKKGDNLNKKQKVGSVVKSSIEEFKENLKEQKKDYKKDFVEND